MLTEVSRGLAQGCSRKGEREADISGRGADLNLGGWEVQTKHSSLECSVFAIIFIPPAP